MADTRAERVAELVKRAIERGHALRLASIDYGHSVAATAGAKPEDTPVATGARHDQAWCALDAAIDALAKEAAEAERERDEARARVATLEGHARGLMKHIEARGERERERFLLSDHACAECCPHSDILEAGFRCHFHALRAALAATDAEPREPCREEEAEAHGAMVATVDRDEEWCDAITEAIEAGAVSGAAAAKIMDRVLAEPREPVEAEGERTLQELAQRFMAEWDAQEGPDARGDTRAGRMPTPRGRRMGDEAPFRCEGCGVEMARPLPMLRLIATRWHHISVDGESWCGPVVWSVAAPAPREPAPEPLQETENEQ